MMVKISKDTTLQEDAQAIIEQFAKDNPERVEKYGMPQFIPETTTTEPWGEGIPEKIERRKKLEELFQYTYEVQDTYHTIDDILRGIPQPTLGLFIDLLQAYKKNLIEDTFKAYPMNIDALNCRNGSMTVIGDLIRLLTQYKKKTIDMEFRDDGKLRAELDKANEKLKENPIDIVTADVQMGADGKRYRKDSLGNFSIPLNN